MIKSFFNSIESIELFLHVRIVTWKVLIMLIYIGMILIAIQFGIDYWAITKGTIDLQGVSDWFGFYLFGLIGLLLVLIGKAWMNHKIHKLEAELYEDEEEDEDYD